MNVNEATDMIRDGRLFLCLKCGCLGDWVCSCDGGNPTTKPITAEEELAAVHELLTELGAVTHIGPDQGSSDPMIKLNAPQRLRQAMQIGRPMRASSKASCPICEGTGRATWLDDCEACPKAGTTGPSRVPG